MHLNPIYSLPPAKFLNFLMVSCNFVVFHNLTIFFTIEKLRSKALDLVGFANIEGIKILRKT